MAMPREQTKYGSEPNAPRYRNMLHQLTVKMSAEDINYCRIGRLLTIDYKTVMRWIKAYPDLLPDDPAPLDVDNAEQDELFALECKKSVLHCDIGVPNH